MQAHNERYLARLSDPYFIVPTREQIDLFSEVTVKDLEDGRIALLADNGKYWGSTNFKKRRMLAANQPNTPWNHSTYKVTYFEDEGKITLQVPDGEYEPYLKPAYSVKIGDKKLTI